jgi:hypothetical protein
MNIPTSSSGPVLVLGSLDVGAAYQAKIAELESAGYEVQKYLVDRIVDGGKSSR